MVGSVAELEEWFEFATGYVDANRSNARRPFDTAARAANRAFTPDFTDAVLALFDQVIANPPPPPKRLKGSRGG